MTGQNNNTDPISVVTFLLALLALLVLCVGNPLTLMLCTHLLVFQSTENQI